MPTPKQLHFIEAYVSNGGNATQAALAAYDCNYETAKVIGHENLTKPNLRQAIEKRMQHTTLTVEDAVRTIKSALDASNDKGSPEWASRLKAADMTLKLADAYPKEARDDAKQVHGGQVLARKLISEGKGYGYFFFYREYGEPPTEAQEAFMLGDDGKWEQARQEGEGLVGSQPVELVLWEGRYERLSEDEREQLLQGELPK